MELGTDRVPNPDLLDLEQVDTESAMVPIIVPVKHDGPITSNELPARRAVVSDFGMTTAMQQVFGEDLKRKCLTMISDGAFYVSHSINGGALWPANVPLVWRNTAPVFVKVASGTADLTCIIEIWSD